MAKSRKKKKAKVIQFKPLSPKKYIRDVARKLPISVCYLSQDIFERGLGQVIVVREKKNGDKVVGLYLIDPWCQGIKDADFKIISSYEYDELMEKMQSETNFKFDIVEANYCFNVVYGAAEYAEDIGLEAHSDFKIAKYVLDPVESVDYIELDFGLDGKPYFAPGPYDNIEKIVNMLNKSIGSDAYVFDEGLGIIDDGFEDERDASWAIVKELLTEKQELEDYSQYCVYVNAVWETVEGDLFELKELLKNSPDDLCKRCDNQFKKIISEEFGADMDVFKPTEPSQVYAIAENMITYVTGDFVDDRDFIKTFVQGKKEDVFDVLSEIRFHNYGTEKIEKIASILLLLLKVDGLPHIEKIKVLKDFLDALEKDIEGKMEDKYLPGTCYGGAILLEISHYLEEIDISKLELRAVGVKE